MASQAFGYVALALLAWWAWNGPIHDWRTVTAEEELQANADRMAHCLRGKSYVSGSGGAFTRDPEAVCARELNLYRHEGRWYSYESARPSDSDANG